MDHASAYAEIFKTSPQEDGSLLVFGRATDSSLDLDQQTCDPAWLKTAMPAWFTSAGNVREQHDPNRAVGKATEYEATDDGSHMITAKIVDPVAKAKCEAGVFTGFSIGVKGARVVKDAKAPGGRINDGTIIEVSLVDRPCNPNATLTVCKAAAPGMEVAPEDLDAERGLVRVEELDVKAADADEAPGDATGEATTETDTDDVEKTADAPEGNVKVEIDGEAVNKVSADAPTPDAGAVEKTAEATVELTYSGEVVKAEGADGQPVARLVVKAISGDDGTLPAEGQKCEACDEDGHIFCVTSKAFGDGTARDLVGAINKADSNEADDIAGAREAIAIIGALIASEAAELAEKPEQAWDIRLLLSAASSLHSFISNEQWEQRDAAVDSVSMAADTDVTKTTDSGEPVPAEQPSSEELVKALLAAPETKALLVKGLIDDLFSAFINALDTEDDDESTEKAATVDKGAPAPARRLLTKFTAIVEDSTKPTAEALTQLSARIDTVEQMATPDGPVLMRGEVAQKNARKADLAKQAQHYRALETGAQSPKLREGYSQLAAQLEEQIRAL
jgi:hypothetical protein